MLQDRDQRVIPAVLRALVAAKSPDAERILTDQLKADDFVVRVAAANGLASLKAKSAIPALVDAYQAAAGDTTYVARAAMLDAVNTIDPAAARALLQAALQDKDWAVRVKAAMLFRDQGIADTRDRDSAGACPSDGRGHTPDARGAAVLAARVYPVGSRDDRARTGDYRCVRSPSPTFIEAGATRIFSTGSQFIASCPIFVIQDGRPASAMERAGPGYTIRDELNQLPYLRGTVEWRSTPEGHSGSQFFITPLARNRTLTPATRRLGARR
jgi:hypothetical protein